METADPSDIIVTARKRDERAFDVPASLNVFSGDSLRNSGTNSLTDLQYRSPGLKIAVDGVGTRISLRGIGTNLPIGSPSVAVHIDGIYVPVTRFALSEFYDIARIEVLKGPEGTLYGRNATGGVINILSEAPGTKLSADGYVGYGNYNLVTAQAGLSLPIDDRGGVRLSATYAKDDGYTKNLNPAGGKIDARNNFGLRAHTKYALSDELTAEFTAQYSLDKGTLGFGSSNVPGSPVYASVPPLQRVDAHNINVDTPPISRQKGLLLSGKVALDLGGVTITSLTGYINYKAHSINDADGSGGFIAVDTQDYSLKFVSQELRLSGGQGGPVNWTTGAYFARENIYNRSAETDNNYPDNAPYPYFDLVNRLRNTTYAIFGEVTLPIRPKLKVVAGSRYTWETQGGTGSLALPLSLPAPIATAGSIDSKAFTPKLLIAFDPSERSHIYASVTRGFKSGGVNLDDQVQTFRPERVWAYEIGAKNRFAGGKAELGLAAFYYDYTNIQLRSVLFTSSGVQTRINNASKASIYGVELTGVVRPISGLTFDGNVAYLHSDLKGVVLPGTTKVVDGLPLPLAPKWSSTVGAEYTISLKDAGHVTGRAEVNYQSEVLFPNFTDIVRERQGGYALVNANLRYDFPGNRTYFALIGRNLFDVTYKTQRFFYAGFADLETYGPARTVEGRLGFRF